MSYNNMCLYAILICPLSTVRVQFARTVFATRATLVAHGNLSNTPRLDHLLTEVSLK